MQIIITCQVTQRKRIGDEVVAKFAVNKVKASVEWYGIAGKGGNGKLLVTIEGYFLPASVLRWLWESDEVIDFTLIAADIIGVPAPNTVRHISHKDALKYERERRGWSQERLAKELGTIPPNVSRWERGVSTPYPYYREKLCALFHKDAEELGLLEENRAG